MFISNNTLHTFCLKQKCPFVVESWEMQIRIKTMLLISRHFIVLSETNASDIDYKIKRWLK